MVVHSESARQSAQSISIPICTVENGSGTHAATVAVPAMGRTSQEYLKLLTRKLITAQEEERRRIARELHDDISQRLAVVSIELEQLAQADEINKSELRQHVRTIQKNIEGIGSEIHDLSRQLHPSKLEHLGLVAAVSSLCREISAVRGFDVEFTVGKAAMLEALPWDLSLCFYRVAQEALQNVARHSRATRAEVRLAATDKLLRLVVSDNGDGFEVTEEKLFEGLGMTSMHERLSSIDGELRIASHPGEGTTVEAVAPLPTQAAAFRCSN